MSNEKLFDFLHDLFRPPLTSIHLYVSKRIKFHVSSSIIPDKCNLHLPFEFRRKAIILDIRREFVKMKDIQLRVT